MLKIPMGYRNAEKGLKEEGTAGNINIKGSEKMSYYESLCGIGPEVYRSRSDIKEDIRCISSRIAEVKESLNIRELIADIFNEEDYDVIKRAEAVTELLKYAEEALEELKALNDVLDELKAELITSTERCSSYERGICFDEYV